MGLTFFDLYYRLHEADVPPPPPSPAGNTPPPPGPGAGPDPLAGGGTMPPPPAGGDPMGGGTPTPPPAKAKIIKITTVWDALENVLGKVAKPKSKELPNTKKELPKFKSLLN